MYYLTFSNDSLIDVRYTVVNNFDLIAVSLKNKLGKPTSEDEDELGWRNARSELSFRRNVIDHSEGELEMFLVAEKDKYLQRSERARAARVRGDL